MSELGVALLVALRIALPGWLWLSRSTSAARVLVTGLALNLVPALILAQGAWWSPRNDWIAWSILVIAGLLRRRAGGVGILIRSFTWIALVTGVLLALPPRSEWLAGGWDPGIYQNSGVVVDRAQGFAPRGDSVFASMTESERELFSHLENNYREAMPAVPLEVETGALQPYFFPLMPLCGGLLHRWGGLDLLVRANQWLAWLGLPVILALAGVLGLGRRARWLFAACWMLSPLWWYHQAIPTTEMLQLFLLAGAWVFYADAHATGQARPWWVALLLALVVIAHFGYAALVAPILVFLAIAEGAGGMAGRVGRIVWAGLGLVVGAVWDLVFARVTLDRLQDKDQVLSVVLIPLALCWAISLILVARDLPVRLRDAGGTIVRWCARIAALALAVLFIAAHFPDGRNWLIENVAACPWLQGVVTRLVRLAPFHGIALLLPALLGACLLAASRDPRTARLRLAALALGAVCVVLVANPGIAPIYPWAFRRYVVFLVPLLALLQVSALTVLWAASGIRTVAAILLAVVIGVGGARASRPAAAVGDYRGLRAALQDVAAHVQADDIVVADDARFGTPLLMWLDRDVLDGGLLWREENETRRSERLRIVERLARDTGRRVLWFTSTDDALRLYSFPMPGAELIHQGPSFAYETVVHSARADAFAPRTSRRVFALWAWPPGPVSSIDSPHTR